MLQSYFIPPDAIDPEDVPHSEIFMPIARPEHDPRRHILLCDAYGEIDRLCTGTDGFRDHERQWFLTRAFHDALNCGLITGGFQSHMGFAACDGVEISELGSVHARVGPYIADWRQGPHRQGAYVVDRKEFANFLEDDPFSAGRASIVVHQDAPVAIRFFAGEGLRLAQSLMPIKQIALAHVLRAAFKKRHADVKLNEKAFDMMAAAYLT